MKCRHFRNYINDKACCHFHFHLFPHCWLKFSFSSTLEEEVQLVDSVGSFCGQNGTGIFVWHGKSFLTCALLKNMFTRSELNSGDLLLHESISFCCGWNLSVEKNKNRECFMRWRSSKLAMLIYWERSEVFREIISRKHFSFSTRQNYFGRWQYKWVTINPVPTAIKSKSSKQREEEKKRATHYHRDENSFGSAVRWRKSVKNSKPDISLYRNRVSIINSLQ